MLVGKAEVVPQVENNLMDLTVVVPELQAVSNGVKAFVSCFLVCNTAVVSGTAAAPSSTKISDISYEFLEVAMMAE